MRGRSAVALCVFLTLAVLGVLPSLASATPAATYIRSFGGDSSGAGKLSAPAGIAVDSKGNIWVSDTGHGRIQEFNSKGEFVSEFGAFGNGDGQLFQPRGIAIDPGGNIWVADSLNSRVEKFNSKGEFTLKFGKHSTADGKFSSLQGIAADPNGHVWTIDSAAGSSRVQEFSGEGTYLSKFGAKGSENGQFKEAHGIAVDSKGNIWVADTGNNRIQEFNSKGEFIAKFGSSGTGNGQLKSPTALSIDSEGNIWVADTGNNRIQEFSGEGSYLGQFGTGGNESGQYSEPQGIVTDAEGHVWIADSGNDRVQEATSSEFIRKFGGEGSEGGQLSNPDDVTTDSKGNVWIADTSHDRVQEFSAEGKFVREFGAKGSADGLFEEPVGLSVDPEGNVWVADAGNNRLEEFSSEGKFIRKVGKKGTSVGNFTWLRDVTTDPEGHVWAVDDSETAPRVEKFNSKGEYMAKFGYQGSGNGAFWRPRSITSDEKGNLWVSDSMNYRVEEFNSKGEFIRKFGSGQGSGNGKFVEMRGITVGPEGNVWVADSQNNRIQEFSGEGAYLGQLGTAGNNDGQFYWPEGVAADSKGNVWVADTHNNRIQEFAASEFIRKFGGDGSGAGHLANPEGVAVDQEGEVWVADSSHNRIQVFSPDGNFIRQFGSYGSSDGLFASPHGIAIDSAGDVWIADTNNDRLQEFNPKGEFIRKFGSAGTENGKFGRVEDIAIDSKGNLWTVDSEQARVQEFTAEGKFVSQFGTKGIGKSELESPQGIAIDAKDNVWVANSNDELYSNRIEEFSSKGEFIGSYGGEGTGNGQYKHPADLAFDPEGNLWIADARNNRVQKLSGEAAYLGQVGVAGNNGGQLSEPLGVATEAEKVFWIADTQNNRVQEWAFGATPTVAIESPTEVSRHKGTLSALVNPNGLSTTYQFEYVDDADFEATGYADATSIPLASKDIGWGTSGVGVNESIEGLEPDTTYHFRVVAENILGKVESKDESLTTPSETPIAAYSFDESEGEVAHDDLGEHDATVEGAKWTTGKYGSSLEFDAEAGDVLSIPDAEDLRLKDFTLEAWVRPAEARLMAPIVAKTSTEGYGYGLYAGGVSKGTAGRPMGFLSHQQKVEAQASSGEELPLDEWSYVAVTSNGKELRLFMNGTLVAEHTSKAVQAGGGSLQIGGDEPFSEGGFFDGKIDEVRIYDRVLGKEDLEEDESAPIEDLSVTISGKASEGSLLTAATGGWAGPDSTTLTYEWQRCGAGGEECEPIEGARGRPYRAQGTDVGHTIRVIARAEPGPLALARSAVTDVVVEPEPKTKFIPTIYGSLVRGRTISVWPGEWMPESTSLSYQWRRCDEDGNGCEDITGATGAYDVQAADVGSTLRVRVTGATSGGSTTVESAASKVVSAPPLENTLPPLVTETATEAGSQLEAQHGTWASDGEEDLNYWYQWERCNAAGADCAELQGQTSSTLALRTSDAGSTFRVAVTARAEGEWETATSAVSDLVEEAKPANVAAPTISGSVRSGERLEGSVGSWTGPQPLEFEYQWELCDAEGEACESMSGATDAELELSSADIGSAVRLEVTAVNESGSATALSEATSVVADVAGPAPELVAAPSISGELELGAELVGSVGVWSGAAEYRLQWERCNQSAQGCEPIAGADEANYAISTADSGDILRLDVLALAEDEAAGEAFVLASQSVRVTGGPANTEAPALTGVAKVGEAISVDSGAWEGAEPISFSYRWQICDPNGCSNVSGSTGTTYTLIPEDAGRTLRALVTAKNANGTTTALSAFTAPVESVVPFAETAPTITAGARTGETVTATHGTWDGEPTISYAYQWRRCDGAGAGCVDISGAEGPSYEFSEADASGTIRVLVTATSPAGQVQAPSPPSRPISDASGPEPTVDPTISGTAEAGKTLSVDYGSWEGSESYAYQWQRCALDPAGLQCAEIPGAIGDSYVAGFEDVGDALRVEVTATGPGGTASTLTRATKEVEASSGLGGTADSLTNTVPPALSGDAEEAKTLSVASGTWQSRTVVSFEYGWRRCDASGAKCRAIEGASGPTYALQSGDIGATVRGVVIASNGSRSRVVASAPSGVVAQAPPRNKSPPTVHAVGKRGIIDQELLAVDTGSWVGSGLAYAYQWQSCDAEGHGCKDLEGGEAQASHYKVRIEEIGSMLKVVVTATNPAGEASIASAPTDVVAPAAPEDEIAPGISGDAYQDGTLEATSGYWRGTPELSYAYQWQRCDEAGKECKDIEGATTSTYTAHSADLGSRLRVVVAAKSEVGSASAVSKASEVIGPARPPVLAGTSPHVAGMPFDGRQLTAEPGTWEGHAPIEFEYQWQRCDEDAEECGDISGASAATYLATGADVGHTIRVEVSATNSSGSASELSEASEPIASGAPADPVPPSIAKGGRRVGSTLEVSPGTWSGSGPIEFEYQWQRCSKAGKECKDIEGATTQTYTADSADARHSVQAQVSASGPMGSESDASDQVLVLPLLSENVSAPSVSGTGLVGEALAAHPGEWSPEPDEFLYQWQRCSSAGDECVDLSGATSSGHTLTSADAGKTLRVRVSAKNDGESDPPAVVSAPTAAINTKAPLNLEPPTLSTNAPTVEETMTATVGAWVGEAPLSYGFQWQSCWSTEASSCSDIGSATEADFTPSGAQDGSGVRVLVTATNARGAEAAASPITEPAEYGKFKTPPKDLTLPTLSGWVVPGSTVYLDTGTWSGATEFEREWLRCDAEGKSCSGIADQQGEFYLPTNADIGHTLRAVVTGMSELGEESATSEPSEVVASPTQPEVGAPPSIEGAAEVGQALSATQGEWTGSPDLEFDYVWKRCDSRGHNCVSIDQETNQPWDYWPARIDAGGTLRVQVTATNGWGSVTAVSKPTAIIPAPSPIANVGIPIFYSDATPEFSAPYWPQELGEWEGEPEVSYQWQRCDPLSVDPETEEPECVDIPGATDPTNFVPGAADVGFSLRLEEIATAQEESQTVFSEPTSEVVTAGVEEEEAGYVGPTVPGITIEAESGVKSEAGLPTTVEYKFLRLEGEGPPQELQDGASPKYKITSEDLGHRIEIEMTVSISRSDEAQVVKTLNVATTTTLVEVAPTNDVAPAVDGDAIAGAPLEAEVGEWHGGGGPLEYAFQWLRCDQEGKGCAEITGATSSTYTLLEKDIGATLRVAVEASSGPLHESATSGSSEVVVPAEAPVNDGLPTISGEAVELGSVEASPGTWSGSEPMSYTYQWQGCGSDELESCLDIAGETEPTLSLGRLETGQWLRVLVTAHNAGHDITAISELVGPVEPTSPPSLSSQPSLTVLGPPVVGSTLMTDGGVWNNVDPSELEYQWLRCSEAGEDCEEVEASDTNSYQIDEEDIGFRLQVEVTASNSTQRVSATSELSPVIEEVEESAEGEMIYLSVDRKHIYASDLEGESPEEIADCETLGGGDTCAFYGPKMAPSGSIILVVLGEEESESEEEGEEAIGKGVIYLMNSDGSEARPFAEGSSPTWSSDGTQIYYTAEDPGNPGAAQIVAAEADGSNVEEPHSLVTLDGQATSIDASPDGESIVFAVQEAPEGEEEEGEEEAQIYLAPLDGSTPEQLSLGSDIREASNPSFTADGSEIVFTAISSEPEVSPQAEETIPPNAELRWLWGVTAEGTDLHPIASEEAATYGPPSTGEEDKIMASRQVASFGSGGAVRYSQPTIQRVANNKKSSPPPKKPSPPPKKPSPPPKKPSPPPKKPSPPPKKPSPKPKPKKPSPPPKKPGSPPKKPSPKPKKPGSKKSIKGREPTFKRKPVEESPDRHDCDPGEAVCVHWGMNDRLEAAAYAEKWSNTTTPMFNPAYYHVGNNCTNFMSQAWHKAGQVFMDEWTRDVGAYPNRWWADTSRETKNEMENSNWSWASAEGFRDQQVASGRARNMGHLLAPDFQEGDVILLNWKKSGGDTVPDHAVIVTLADGTGRYVASETAARHHEPWNKYVTKTVPDFFNDPNHKKEYPADWTWEVVRPEWKASNRG